MAASCGFLRLHKSYVKRLRRLPPSQLLEDPLARLRQHEKRGLFPAFACHEPVLPNKILGLKTRDILVQFPTVIGVSTLGEIGKRDCPEPA